MAWPAAELHERQWRSSPGARVPSRDRNVLYVAYIPPRIAGATLELSGALAARVERATLSLARLDAAEGLDASIVPLLRTESSASSKIEQIAVGQRHVGRALAGLPARRSAQEVAANVEALRTAVASAQESPSRQTFNRIHAVLMVNGPSPGQPRTTQNWVGGSDYSPRAARFVPPPPELVTDLLDDLAAFLARADLPALCQAAVAHAQFECIHPYADGNGRTGRALWHMVLRRRNVVCLGIAPLSLPLLADRERYFEGLVAYQRGEVEGWIGQFADAAEEASRIGRELAETLRELRDEWRLTAAVADARAGSTLRRVVDDLTAHPVMDAQQVALRYGVSPVAARNALNALQGAGILRPVSAARNHLVWEAHEVFAALDEAERSAGVSS